MTSDVCLHFYLFLGGSLTRQVEQDASVSDSSPHIANIGKMVEDMENKIRYDVTKYRCILCLYFVVTSSASIWHSALKLEV